VSLFKTIKARAAKPVETESLGTVYLRDLSYGELDRIKLLKGTEHHDFITLALMLADETGQRLMTQRDGETDEQLAIRTRKECPPELTPAHIEELAKAFASNSRVPTPERLEKN